MRRVDTMDYGGISDGPAATSRSTPPPPSGGCAEPMSPATSVFSPTTKAPTTSHSSGASSSGKGAATGASSLLSPSTIILAEGSPTSVKRRPTAFSAASFATMLSLAAGESMQLFKSAKGIVLVILVAQSCAGLLLTRYTRARPHDGPADPPLFTVACAVMCTEAIKLFFCFWWVFCTEFKPSKRVLPEGTSKDLEGGSDASVSESLVAGAGSSKDRSSASVGLTQSFKGDDGRDSAMGKLKQIVLSPSRFADQCQHVLRVSLWHKDSWHMLPPAVLFTFQSNIIYVALQNVEVTLFQVLYQSKLLLTALFVGYAFKRSFSKLQWLSLFALFIGVVISQLGASAPVSASTSPPAPISAAPSQTSDLTLAPAVARHLDAQQAVSDVEGAPGLAASHKETLEGFINILAGEAEGNNDGMGFGDIPEEGEGGGAHHEGSKGGYGSSSVLGIVALLASSVSSAVAAVVMEKVIKDAHSPQSLAIRNVQLATFSLLLTAVVYYYTVTMQAIGGEPAQTLHSGVPSARPYPPPLLHNYIGDFFLGFDGYVWALVINQAVGGILVALVLKYADNILKGFATAVCIFICGLFSYVVWETHLAPGFMVGATIVTISVVTYSVASS